ncbi:MAG TPA: aminopeptidase [Gammaproteobacteria bacterium]
MLPEAPRNPALLRLAGTVLACAVLGGCYLAHVAGGQAALNASRTPLPEVMADPTTPGPVRERLEYVARVRQFASQALALPDNDSYKSYADLGRPYVAWNVFAAPEFSVQPRRWCFPIAGCVAYRGYFDEAKAVRYARGMHRRGEDVHLAPVAAYSTLGHFADPVLSSMLEYPDVELAALLFHELAHQVVYVRGDSAFNEAFAMVVEFEGARRFLEAIGRADELGSFLESRRRFAAAAALVTATRDRLAALYAAGGDESALRDAKQRELQRLATDYERLRDGWPDGRNMDRLMSGTWNNARLAAIATYHRCVPGMQRLLAGAGGDLPTFYAAVRELGARPPAERARLCDE